MDGKSVRRGKTEFVCHIIAVLLMCIGLACAASGFIFDWLRPEFVSSFPSWLYLLRIVPFAVAAAVAEIVCLVLRWWKHRGI